MKSWPPLKEAFKQDRPAAARSRLLDKIPVHDLAKLLDPAQEIA